MKRYVVLMSYTPGDCLEGPTGSGEEWALVTAPDGDAAIDFVKSKRAPLTPWDSPVSYEAYALAEPTRARSIRYDHPLRGERRAVYPPAPRRE
jgi:hypothetical protein